MIDRRTLLKTSAAAGGLAAVQGALTALGLTGPALAATGLTSTRSTAKSWLWAPEDYARDAGLFDRVGLAVTSNATTRGVNVDAVLSEATDVMLGAPTNTMRAQIQRQPVKMIAGLVNKYASHVIVKKDVLDRLGVHESAPVERKAAALRGLKLGTTGPGAAPDSLFRFLLGKGKLDPDRDVELVTVQGGGQGMLAAFERGAINGFCLSSPTSDVAVQKFGGAYLFNMTANPPAELRDYLYIGVTVSQRTIEQKPRLLVDYCKGLALALRAIEADHAAFRKWALGFFEGLAPGVFDTAFDVNGRIYMKTPMPTEPQFKLNVEFLDGELKRLGGSGVPASFKFTDAWDTRFAAEALRSI